MVILGVLAKQLSATTNKNETIKELLEMVFSIRSDPRLYSELPSSAEQETSVKAGGKQVVSCLAFSSTLKMEAICSSET
jgi:hypothetical protein